MPTPSPGYAITLRVEVPASTGATGELTAAVNRAGGVLTALDVAESHADRLVVDVTCDATDAGHADEITAAVDALPGFVVRKVSDRTFLIHLGGKLEVTSKVQLRHRDDLSRAYTPGRRPGLHGDREEPRRRPPADDQAEHRGGGHRRLRRARSRQHRSGRRAAGDGGQGRAVQAVRRGRRVAGLPGHPGHRRDRPRSSSAIAPVYGGINLEDIAAPRCFEIEARLREALDIPVFHDDQHGTAIVVLAALTNALRVVDKQLPDVRIVVSGVGAAGHAIIRLLHAQGVRHIVALDAAAPIHAGQDRRWTRTAVDRRRTPTPTAFTGSLPEALAGADVFIGVSAPNLFDRRRRGHDGRPTRSCSRCPTPTPRSTRSRRAEHAAVVATGRSDYPNQINNVLAFPGVLPWHARRRRARDHRRDAGRRRDRDRGLVGKDELNPSYIVPSVFDPAVARAVAAAVRQVAQRRVGALP